jgi:hypothetical protein
VSHQIKSYLEEITEEDPADGFLVPRQSHEIAGQLGEEMKSFSRRLQERKEKERI